jgi:hypothetical protein
MNFDQQPPNPDRLESEKIIQKLDLKAGKEITLIKKNVASQSALQVGHTLHGKITSDVKIGFPIQFEDGSNTSNVKSIQDGNGRYLITTMTSVYEMSDANLEKGNKKITDFESFETGKGSIYKVLENGQIQRTKNVLDDPNYLGEDKGDKKEKEPSDIILFYDQKKGSGYLDDFSATDSKSGNTIAQSITIGVYKKINDETYQLVRNNLEIDSSFIFVRVRKDDPFKLKESFTFQELKDFQERTMKPENKGLGVLIPSEGGNITNMPAIGLNTVDYKYGSDGKVASMHTGNKIVSLKERL